MKIGIIGTGRAGGALALAASGAGHRVAGVNDKDEARAKALAAEVDSRVLPPALLAEESEVIFLSVPDDSIEPAAAALAPELAGLRGKIYFHMSGAHPASLLAPLAGSGFLGSLHPLLTLAEAEEGARRLRSCFFAFEGDSRAEKAARLLVTSLGSRLMVLRAEDKARYHAAAVFLSNYLLSVVDTALRIYESLGLDRRAALEAAWPLVQATLDNLRNLGTEAALTGPISRGDVQTVRGHLVELARIGAGEADLYRALGKATLTLACRAGRLDASQEASLLGILRSRQFPES